MHRFSRSNGTRKLINSPKSGSTNSNLNSVIMNANSSTSGSTISNASSVNINANNFNSGSTISNPNYIASLIKRIDMISFIKKNSYSF